MPQKRSRIVLWGLPLIVIGLIANVIVFRRQADHGEKPPTAAEIKQAQDDERARRAQERDKRRAEAEARQKRATEARVAEEDRFIASLYGPERRRWTVMPSWISQVYVDPAGHAWFRRDGSGSDLKSSVEEAVARGSRIVRGGEIILVDRRGGVWLRGSHGSVIGYVNGKWEERTGTGRPATQGSGPAGRIGGGWEDSAGRLWFMGGSAAAAAGYGMHCRSPDDGTWTFHPVEIPPAEFEELMDHRPHLVEQARGMMTLHATWGNDQKDADEVRVLHFDGVARWQALNPRVCADSGHVIDEIIPLHNGSIATLCGSEALMIYWPPPAAPLLEERMQSVIARLDDPDVAVRDAAAREIVSFGYAAVEPLRAALQSGGPEAEERIRRALGQIDQEEKTCDQWNRARVLYGGRFHVDQIYLVNRGGKDGPLFHMLELCDHDHVVPAADDDGQPHHVLMWHALGRLRHDGTWDVTQIPHQEWKVAGWNAGPMDRRFQDARGRLWVAPPLRTDADMRLRADTSDGMRFKEILAEDKDGRLFVSGGGFGPDLVLDESAPPAKSELAEETFHGKELYRLPGERVAWTVDVRNWPHTLVRLAEGKRVELPRNWKDEGIWQVVPLRGDAAVVLLQGRNRMVGTEFGAMLHDGAGWHTAEWLRPMVKGQPQLFARLAGHTFEEFNSYRVATDGAGHVWFAWNGHDSTPEPDRPWAQTYVELLEYWDGQQWHDAWAELKALDAALTGNVIRGADRGRTVLIETRDPDRRLVAVRYDDAGTLRADTIIDTGKGIEGLSIRCLDGADGELWIDVTPRGGQRTILRYRDGKTRQETPPVSVRLVDSAGRAWSIDDTRGVVRVKHQQTEASIVLPGLHASSTIVESPDGRIWALHLEGISLLALRQDSNAPTIEQRGRWRWAAPRAEFHHAFVDAAGFLWLNGKTNSVTRIALPPDGAARAPAP